jgi:hypothetical protein
MTIDPVRFQAEAAAAENFLMAFWSSEVQFHSREWPEHNEGTPTAREMLRALANTLNDNFGDEHGEDEDYFGTMADLETAADAEHAALLEAADSPRVLVRIKDDGSSEVVAYVGENYSQISEDELDEVLQREIHEDRLEHMDRDEGRR